MVAFHPSRFNPAAAVTMLRSWHSWHRRDTTSRFGPSGKSRGCATAVPNVATVSARVPNNKVHLFIQLSPFSRVDLSLLARYEHGLAVQWRRRIYGIVDLRHSDPPNHTSATCSR